MDPRLASILAQCKVRAGDMDKLGDAGCENAQVFGHVAKTEEVREVH